MSRFAAPEGEAPRAEAKPQPASETASPDVLASWVAEIILDHEHDRPRSRQMSIGPSGVRILVVATSRPSRLLTGEKPAVFLNESVKPLSDSYPESNAALATFSPYRILPKACPTRSERR